MSDRTYDYIKGLSHTVIIAAAIIYGAGGWVSRIQANTTQTQKAMDNTIANKDSLHKLEVAQERYAGIWTTLSQIQNAQKELVTSQQAMGKDLAVIKLQVNNLERYENGKIKGQE